MTEDAQQRKQVLERLKVLAEKSEQTTAEISAQLYQQKQKLSRIQQTTNGLDIQANKTKKLSRQIYSLWYYVKDKWTGRDKNSEPSATITNDYINTNGTSNKLALPTQPNNKQEDENKILDGLSSKMKTLISMNKNIGKQLQQQNQTIDRVTEKSDKINDKITYSKQLLQKKLG